LQVDSLVKAACDDPNARRTLPLKKRYDDGQLALGSLSFCVVLLEKSSVSVLRASRLSAS